MPNSFEVVSYAHVHQLTVSFKINDPAWLAQRVPQNGISFKK